MLPVTLFAQLRCDRLNYNVPAIQAQEIREQRAVHTAIALTAMFVVAEIGAQTGNVDLHNYGCYAGTLVGAFSVVYVIRIDKFGNYGRRKLRSPQGRISNGQTNKANAWRSLH